MRLERFKLWFGLCLAGGLGAWIASMFPHLVAGLAGCGAMYFCTRNAQAPRCPTPQFHVTWGCGAATAAIIGWEGSIVPPLSCLLAAFLGSAAMYFATFFEKEEKDSEDFDGCSALSTGQPSVIQMAIVRNRTFQRTCARPDFQPELPPPGRSCANKG